MSDRVLVDRDVLEELVRTARGDVERLVEGGAFDEEVVDDLVATIEEAEAALEEAEA